ncbi:MAG: hypothetical protein IPK05_03210 [Comamonadaceae bacterium]|nr:hypothetical protein [Comamonadaceae bacterium]
MIPPVAPKDRGDARRHATGVALNNALISALASPWPPSRAAPASPGVAPRPAPAERHRLVRCDEPGGDPSHGQRRQPVAVHHLHRDDHRRAQPGHRPALASPYVWQFRTGLLAERRGPAWC